MTNFNRKWKITTFLFVVCAVVFALANHNQNHNHITAWPKPPEQFEQDPEVMEREHVRVAKFVKSSLLRHLRNLDFERMPSALHPEFKGYLPTPGDYQRVKNDGSFAVAKIVPKRKGEVTLDGPAFVKKFSETMSDAAQVKRANWKAFKALTQFTDVGMRHFGQAHLHLGYENSRNERYEIQWDVDAEFVETAGELKLLKFAVAGGHKIDRSRVAFIDVSSESGLNQLGNAGVLGLAQTSMLTILDFNKDGYWDILTSYDHLGPQLYLNDGQNGFTKQKLPMNESSKQCLPRFYLWIDLDSDGQEELVTTEVEQLGDRRSSIVLYRMDPSGRLIRAPAGNTAFKNDAAPATPILNSIAPCDIDGDGDLDLIFGSANRRTASISNRLSGDQLGGPNLLFVNQGALQFTEEAEVRGFRTDRTTTVSECFDFDGDGDFDVLFGNDFASNDYYTNDGTGYFNRDAKHEFNQHYGFTMGVSIADYDNSGDFSAYFANMYSHAGHRLGAIKKDLFDRNGRTLFRAANGNNLFGLRGGVWTDAAVEKGVNNGDWSWASVFFDHDNDGDKDLYVTNGFVTSTDDTVPDF